MNKIEIYIENNETVVVWSDKSESRYDNIKKALESIKRDLELYP